MSNDSETNEAGSEGRIHPRAPIELKVEYKKMNTFFSDYTKNISKGGTFIKTERPLKVGTEFVFKLAIPVLDKPFEIKGQVAWVNTEGEQQRPEVEEHGMGIKFIYEDPNQRQQFEGVVEDLMKESLGDTVYKKLLERSRR
jgi:type IV pilus assembly protein PilZ